MSDKEMDDLGPDNWLHIASHALALYAQAGGEVVVEAQAEGLMIRLVQVAANDERLHYALLGLASSLFGCVVRIVTSTIGAAG